MNVVMVLDDWSKTHKRCSDGNGSMGVPVEGSLAELEINTLVPSFDTASTLPIGTGVTNEAVAEAVSRITRPALVPIKARTPAWSNTMEFGTPGRLIAVPATGGVLLMSMGMMVLEVPAGGVNELAAYTVVVIGLFPFTVMPKRLL